VRRRDLLSEVTGGKRKKKDPTDEELERREWSAGRRTTLEGDAGPAPPFI